MKYKKYYDVRDVITEIMRKDLLGPVEEDEIICGELPLDYYITGKLYPKNMEISDTNSTSSEDCGDFDNEDAISMCNGKYPSSFGISFCLRKDARQFVLSASAAKYELMSEAEKILLHGKDAEEKTVKSPHWKRCAVNSDDIIINVDELCTGKSLKNELDSELYISVLLHRVLKNGEKIITVSMINNKQHDGEYKKASQYAYFQPEIKVKELCSGTFGTLDYKTSLTTDPELIELDMLYRNVKKYVSGHGCAANYIFENELLTLYSDFLPESEVLQMKPSTRFSGRILSMKALSEMRSDDVISGLFELTGSYEKWIEKQELILEDKNFKYSDAGRINLDKCRQTLERMKRSVNALKDKDVFRAFSLANRVMFNQRKNMLVQNNKFTSDEAITWYPFQLAFFIQEIISFADEKCADRKLTDLLWFPTGGGKTEAYLGIAAFVIFLRRLRNKDKGAGVSVIMRYTMRLLTFQQFERASAMICNCELVRRQEKIPGGEIGIGLWVGSALTPNRLDDAKKILVGDEDSEEYKIGNPVQLAKCPYCGGKITSENYSIDTVRKRMKITCSSAACEFRNGLPVYLIDEEIYEHRPAYIVATIDKFAQLAVNEECAALFGSRSLLPPGLIIQDELHLISGPLGTVTGLYEAAIQKLCTNNGIKPKVIASTATIRNASEQIKGLYASEHTQFPPQAVNYNDSFFAELSTREEKPARKYIGCMGIGTSPTTMMIRTLASELFATRYLSEQDADESVIDSYWTLTAYFNSLRELGGAVIRVLDDVQDRFLYLQNTKFSKTYPMKLLHQRYTKYKELTSREKSEDIGKVIQEELTIPFKKDKTGEEPYDFILSSNMISVGVDVSRLGIMQVVGQPKTTAEYIQATSRVGRENPGLVVTTYNQTKSRDRSHYEQFYPYHASFYKFVEATSITPFSDRARDRALHTLYVMLCRYSIPELFRDEDAVKYRKDIPELNAIRKYIFDYVEVVDPDELENVKYEISVIEDEWEEKRGRNDVFRYKKSRFSANDKCLFDDDFEEDSRFRVMNSMRSVENSIQVKAGV